jgi:hypothetical protein
MSHVFLIKCRITEKNKAMNITDVAEIIYCRLERRNEEIDCWLTLAE